MGSANAMAVSGRVSPIHPMLAATSSRYPTRRSARQRRSPHHARSQSASVRISEKYDGRNVDVDVANPSQIIHANTPTHTFTMRRPSTKIAHRSIRAR